MDAKDLRTETALGERNNDGSKYSHSGGTALHCDRNKSYQDIGSNSLAKVDVQNIRPCAVIGPDRIVPPPASSETYIKKAQSEPWSCIDNAYHNRLPPEYPHKLVNFQSPTRNISPRQTFQENMQRIMVPPSYSSITLSDESKYTQTTDRNSALHKNIKINVPPEAKFCDVPYNVYPKNTNDQKSARIPDMCLNTVKPTITRTAPHGWPPGSANIHPTRAYGAPELYSYQDYSNCAGPRPALPRCNRNVPEDSTYIYAEPYYHQEGNIRFKPYPPVVKERLGHQRYDYIGNYSNTFHPPPAFHAHKYELQKPVQPHPYPPYPPIKYLDRPPETIMDGYQRNQQSVYNIPYHNQTIHPNYAPVLGNTSQNKLHSYPSEGHIKSLPPNKHEYENSCPKIYSSSDNYLVNEMGRMQSMKGQVIMPNYPPLNIHNIPLNTYYKKDNHHMKGYEYLPPHIRSMDPSSNIHNSIIRHGPVYPSTTLAMSPTDSIGSTDNSHMMGTSQEDCGYVSQSSTASIRSIDSGINRIPNEYLRKYYDSRYGPIIRTNSMMSKNEHNGNSNTKEKKNLNVRQFLQMWNEGDEETDENNSKEIIVQAGVRNDKFNKGFEVINQPNQEQLYVLGLVNVPREELAKYEHIQKVSKLPENIKGYNHIELLNQFEEAIESSNMSNYKTPKDYQTPFKGVSPFRPNTTSIPPRPISPLDVEAKISQSIIHKEVGCNFEIKPCSPKMLNVEVATPVHNILAERAIEKVANPVMLKSPRLNTIENNIDCNINRKDNSLNMNNESVSISSCKMVNPQFSNHNSIDAIKNSYSLHDLESSSGLCLASLPRLDNDIELNFPEVNQQFINANKRDSTSSANSVRDLPTLEELDQLNNQTQNRLNNTHALSPDHDIIKSPCFVDLEKEGREFSKLSKYRKSKTHASDLKENINATRTDSVIIKNPENSKNYEDNISSPHCLNENKDSENAPINLTSQGNSEDDADNTLSIKPHENNETDIPVDIAIDFSLSKTNSNDNFECKTIESLTHNIIESNNSILDNHLTKISLFSDCDQSDISNPIRNIGNVKKNENNTDNMSREGVNRENEYSSPTSNEGITLQIPSEEKDCTSPGTSLGETNNISSSTLLPIEFITPTECLQTSYDKEDNIEKNHKLDIQTVHELNDVLNITNTHNQVDEIFNKNSDDFGKAVEPNLDIHQSNDRNLNHTIQSTSVEYSQDIKGSDLQITDHLTHTGKTAEIEDHQTINCFDLKLNDTHETKLAGACPLQNPRNMEYSKLKSPDELNHSENTEEVENRQNVNCSESKSIDDNYTEHTIAIKDPENVNSSDLNLPNDINQKSNDTHETELAEACHLQNPRNMEYSKLKSSDELNHSENTAEVENRQNVNFSELKSIDDNYTEQTIAIEDPENVNCSDLNLPNINHIRQTTTIDDKMPQNITCSNLKLPNDLNYSEQANQSINSTEPSIQQPLNINCSDSKLSNKEIPDSNHKEHTPKNILMSYSDDVTMDIQNNCLLDSKTESNKTDIDISENRDDSYINSNSGTIIIASPNNCETDYQNPDLNLPSPNQTLIADETISSQNDISIQDDISTQDVDHGQTKTTVIQNETNFDTVSPNDSKIYRCNIDTHLRKTDSNILHPILNNITTCNSNEQASQITKQDTNDNSTIVNNISINAITNLCNDYTVYNKGLFLPENDHEVEKSCTEKKDISETTDKKQNASCSIVSLIKDEKRSQIPRKCLSYGSKEMYSPQIQNLVVFCEGIINAKKIVVSNHSSNYCAFTCIKTIHNTGTSSCNNCLKDHYEQCQHKMDSIEDFVSTTNKNNVIETIKSSNQLDVEFYPKTENKDVNKQLETNTVNEQLNSINTLFNNDELNSSVKFAQNITEYILPTTSSSIADETTKNMTKNCDELKSSKILEEISGCLPELTNICDIQNIHDTGMVHSVCSNETNGLEILCESIVEEQCSAQESQSSFSNELLNANDVKSCQNVVNQMDKQIFCDVDMFISMEKQFNNREDTSEIKIGDEICEQREQLNFSQELTRKSYKKNNAGNEMNALIDKQFSNEFLGKDKTKDSKCTTKISEPIPVNIQYKKGKQPTFDYDTPDHMDNLSKCEEEIVEPSISQYNYVEEVSTRLISDSISSDELSDNTDVKKNICEETNYHGQVIKKLNSSDKNLECWNGQSNNVTNFFDKILRPSENQTDYSDKEETGTHLELSCSEIPTQYNLENKKRRRLKRSLSDSALNIFKNSPQDQDENESFLWPFKRKKTDNVDNHLLAQNLCSIIQNNRRNSVSTFYNEDDVSFCILIDNSCIIAETEEENDEQEKICYTEISEGCLDEIPDDSESHEDNAETTTESVTSQQENDCDYSDSYLLQSEDNKLTESWVEDVGCVETIIGDDIAENVEISGPLSPKDDASSDNDESEVFSNSEHTDKVKFIYGHKMCNDDAQFVQILYNTPQMDVNKTLVRKESVVAAEYYDNYSLEKVLSDPGDNKLSSYLPRPKEIEETKDKEIQSITSWQKNNVSLDVVDVAMHESDVKERTLGEAFNDENDIVHSCESSTDNVFTYDENAEDKNYIISSSPEVSSTTSEDKNSTILLKITNYKGTRVSQVNDISRDRSRPRCKFTENKGYIQSHVNFPTHRPLLTKGAQKYIPPLKESIRDLKVKLTLPQHSLMKLKQLKNSKEQPKVYKQANSVPRYSKKPKPKFEDVLKNIDEIQFKMHKDKAKKSKKSVPKVVIKKNENGSHYASTSSRTDFNPDLTGRKWQPWVFIEKNSFIDKMAVKRKIKAVYSHRKKTYVLAEKFQKYKSVNDTKFIITPPVSDSPSTGLKYTIRLKHNY